MSNPYDEGPSVWCSRLHPLQSYSSLSLHVFLHCSFSYLRVSFFFVFIHLPLFLPVKLKGHWAGVCSSAVSFTLFLLFFSSCPEIWRIWECKILNLLWNGLVIMSSFFFLYWHCYTCSLWLLFSWLTVPILKVLVKFKLPWKRLSYRALGVSHVSPLLSKLSCQCLQFG